MSGEPETSPGGRRRSRNEEAELGFKLLARTRRLPWSWVVLGLVLTVREAEQRPQPSFGAVFLLGGPDEEHGRHRKERDGPRVRHHPPLDLRQEEATKAKLIRMLRLIFPSPARC